jgi:predicted amidohydrolase
MIQMQVTDDSQRNVNRAMALMEEALDQSPHMIVLPENFHLMGTNQQFFEQAETIDGPTVRRFRKMARERNVYIVAGTMKMRFENEEKLRNTTCVINPDGEIQDLYHKIHTFHANVGGTEYRGSEVESSGNQIVVTDIYGVPVGLSVCFDIRFPEMYRIMALKGAKVILVPSIFMLHTGKDHWETLLKARAIENQLYIVAPAVYGPFPPKQNWSYGRSVCIDPWGIVIAQASDHETTVTVDLDLELIQEVREKVPTLSQRRPYVYRWDEVDPIGSVDGNNG